MDKEGIKSVRRRRLKKRRTWVACRYVQEGRSGRLKMGKKVKNIKE